jgi:hypothetical protein
MVLRRMTHHYELFDMCVCMSVPFFEPGMRSCALGKFFMIFCLSGLRPRVGFPITLLVGSMDITI